MGLDGRALETGRRPDGIVEEGCLAAECGKRAPSATREASLRVVAGRLGGAGELSRRPSPSIFRA